MMKTYRDDMITKNFATPWVMVDTATQVKKVETLENHVFVDMVVNDLYERTTKDGRTWYEWKYIETSVHIPIESYNENPDFYLNTEINKNNMQMKKRNTSIKVWDDFITKLH